MGKQIKINKKSDDKQKRITVSFKEVEDDLELYNWLIHHPKVQMLGISGIVKLALTKAKKEKFLED